MSAKHREELLELIKDLEEYVFDLFDEAGEDWFEWYLEVAQYPSLREDATDRYVRQIVDDLWRKVDEMMVKGAEVSVDLALDGFLSVFESSPMPTERYEQAIKKLGEVTAKDANDHIWKGIPYDTKWPLSTRIWRSVDASGRRIDDVIREALDKGVNSAELAKILEPFLKPGSFNRWTYNKIKELLGEGYANSYKNFIYEALRLARTTIMHAAIAAQKESAKLNPYYNHVIWRSAHAPGRTCTICEDRDGIRYTLRDVPYDHPNGLCWLEPSHDKTPGQIRDEVHAWLNGDSNPRLDEWWESVKDNPRVTGDY